MAKKAKWYVDSYYFLVFDFPCLSSSLQNSVRNKEDCNGSSWTAWSIPDWFPRIVVGIFSNTTSFNYTSPPCLLWAFLLPFIHATIFFSAGRIVGWEYYSGRTGTTLKFSVMRAMATPAASNCPMMVVGVTSTTSGTSGEYHRLDLSSSEQISVKQGDYLAITFRGGSNL